VVEQGALADACLAAKDDDPTAAIDGVGHRGVEKLAFCISSKQPHGQIAYLGRLRAEPYTRTAPADPPPAILLVR